MPSLIPLDNTLGAAFIGIVLSSIIYGVTWLQVFLYYTKHCSRDRLFLKLFVAFLMSLDTFHVALVVMCGYHYAVTNFGDYIALETPAWSLVWQAFIGGLLSVVVDAFFAYRIYGFSKRRLLPVIILTLCLAKLACAIGFTVQSLKAASFEDGYLTQTWSICALATSIACDFLIAVSTIYYLQKGRTGFTRTNRAITLLITYSLNTCLLTGIFNIVCIAFWITSDSTLLYALFYFILVRLYSCAFMSILNSRETVRKELDGTDAITMSHLVAVPPTSVSDSFQSGQTQEYKAQSGQVHDYKPFHRV